MQKKIFERYSSPKRITDELFAMSNIPIVPGKTLLFLDLAAGGRC
jgi:hypothetical protein